MAVTPTAPGDAMRHSRLLKRHHGTPLGAAAGPEAPSGWKVTFGMGIAQRGLMVGVPNLAQNPCRPGSPYCLPKVGGVRSNSFIAQVALKRVASGLPVTSQEAVLGVDTRAARDWWRSTPKHAHLRRQDSA